MIHSELGNPLINLLGCATPQVILNLATTLGPLNKGFSKLLQDSRPELNLRSLKHHILGSTVFKLSRDPKVYIASLICIQEFPSKFNKEAFKPQAFKKCLQEVIRYAKDIKAQIHITKIPHVDLYLSTQVRKEVDNLLLELFLETDLTIWDIYAEEEPTH
jgi:hypothetical protein